MSQAESTRRGFLKRSAGIAAAVPYIWTSSYARAQDKNDRPTIALIGCGGQGSGDARSAARHGDLVACCDPDRERAERFSGGKLKIYEDYRKMFDEQGKNLDVIVCGTTDQWHTAANLAAINAGCDIYGEKPLTLTIDEGKLICKAVKEKKTVFQVGTQQRSGGQFQRAVAYARSGRLGKNITATCYIGAGPKGGPFKEEDPPPNLNWDLWLGQAPKVPYIKERCHYQFRWWLEYSGGKLTDWGAHHVDIAQWGIGAEDTGAIEIEGEGVFDERKNCYNTALTFKCTLKFANGCTIIVTHGPGNGILFEGEKGRIFVNRGAGPKGAPFENMSQADKDWLEGEVAKLYGGNKSGGHMGNFYNCIRDRKDPISDVYSHHRAMTSCHQCNIAMKLKRKLKYDPVKEDFVGDADASAMISRQQRKGYTIAEWS